MDSVLRGFIEKSVSFSDGFVNQLGGEVVDSFRAGLEKVYYDNLVKCPVALTHVLTAGATSVSW